MGGSGRLLSLSALLFSLLAGCATPVPYPDPLPGATITRHPHFYLTRGEMEVWVADPAGPEAYYQGQRFVRTAMVAQARWRGQSVFAEYTEGRTPRDHDHVGGTAEEFDYHGPESFPPDRGRDVFLKLGVGLLRRTENAPEEDYGHWREYEWVKRPTLRTFQPEPGRVVFEEELVHEAGGLGYAMVSAVRVMEDGNGFMITRTLTNRGAAPLLTEHYSHNFLRVGEQPVGSAYRLCWSEPVDWRWIFGEEHGLQVGEKGLGFEKAVMTEGIYLATDPEQNMGRSVRFTLTVRRPGGSRRVGIQVDRPLWRAVLWGQPDVLCPELFVHIPLEPGASTTWSTTYRFSAEP